MNFLFTARHFKAHESLKKLAEAEAMTFPDYYDGITRTEVILSYEKSVNSVKTAEIIVHANNHHIFTAKESSDDFAKAIEGASRKIITQLRKFHDKIKHHHVKDNSSS